MANNPAMMKMAADRMANMTPQEMENIAKLQQQQAAASSTSSASGNTGSGMYTCNTD